MSVYQTLTETLQKIKRSEERLTMLIENKASLEAKVREKKAALDKENYDVEKLEGLSLEGFVHLLKGTLIDKLDKEEREAMVAKNQYEIACQELDVCLKEISLCRDRLKEKFTIERQYLDFIESEEKKILDIDSNDSKQVKTIIDQVYYNNEVLREIREAKEAGDQLKEAFNCILESFSSADDLGIIDILENGLLVSDCGHESVKKTNEQLVLIQQNIRRYHIEVMDVLGVTDLHLDISRLLVFSDCFLVRVIEGDELSEKLDGAVELIKEMMRHIDESLLILDQKRNEIKIEIEGLKKSKVQLVESYLNQIGGIHEKSS
ncbi:hypothetical protein EZV73_08325 [Acidaminobacter sp. JC074]|uniref:hypothetical protein n=1 Tax=Acidaminobacter sp. JC074 TaxID=2530199 RepID=UPI001F107B38|nr:hypothetical protein [Acidaminobacter sp. JC074]MCH4887575.1 hypothetical protein [Acidaminobacter sp. JC074]